MSTIQKTSGSGAGTVAMSAVQVFPDRPAEYNDEALVQIVTQDEARADAYVSSQQWAMTWREAEILYQAPRNVSTWGDGNTTRSNVSRFTVAKHCNSIVPELISGMFYDSPPFLLRPRRGTSQYVVRAKTELFAVLLDEMEFQREVELCFEDMVLLGTMIAKFGTSKGRKVEEVVKRKTKPIRYSGHFGQGFLIHTQESDEFEVEEQEKEFWEFWFERKEIQHVLIAPGWRTPDIQKAKYVIEVNFCVFDDLNDLRTDPEYNIPPTEELKKYFFPPKEASGPETTTGQQNPVSSIQQAQPRNMEESADPLLHPLKLVERWTKDRVVTILRGGSVGGLIIRNAKNKFRKIPYLSANYWNVKGSGYGLGLGRIIGQDQRIETGTTNGILDILSMVINQQYVRSRGADAPTQQIRARLGGIIDVDGPVDKALKILEPPKVDGALFSMLREASAQAESAGGANEQLVQGQMPQRGRTSLGRTATGASEMASATATRLQGPLGHFINGVFLPFVRMMDRMVNLEMPMEQIREVLGEELGEEFYEMVSEAESRKSDFFNELFQSKFQYEVLAGTYMAARKAMAQALPLIAQIFENPQLLQQLENAGWIIDVKELFEMFMEVSGWKNQRTLIRRMTKAELRRVAQMSKGVQAMQMQQAKFRQQQQLEDERNLARSGDTVLREVVRNATTGAESPISA